MSISSFRDFVEEEVLSSKKRFAGILVVVILLLSLPVTYMLVSQQQDIRQRADVIDPADLCYGHGGAGGATWVGSACGGYNSPGNPLACGARNTQVYQCSDGEIDAYICDTPECVTACSSPPWCPATNCPATAPSVRVSCSGTTVTCTWSTVTYATSWNADIVNTVNNSTNCRSAYGGTGSCDYNSTSRTLTQYNAPAGTYKCSVGAFGDSYLCTQRVGESPDTCPVAAPLPTATSAPLPTATRAPVAAPLPTATSAPLPTATRTPLPTATRTPVATSTPIPTATRAPVATPTPTRAPTAAPTPTTQPGAVPVTFAITTNLIGIGTNSYDNNSPKNPQRAVTLSLYDTQNRKIKDATGTLSYQGGKYTGNVLVQNVTPGSYYAKFRLNNTLLKKTPPITASTGGTNNFAVNLPLTSGDIFSGNRIDLQSYNTTVNCYQGNACDQNYKKLADLNDDGFINAKDINIILVAMARGNISGD